MIIRVKGICRRKTKKKQRGERTRERERKKKASDLDCRSRRFIGTKEGKGIGEVACLVSVLRWRQVMV